MRPQILYPIFADIATLPGVGPSLPATARHARDAGADAITLVNTLPGRVLDRSGTAVLGAGQGGVSGPALRPVGVQAVAAVRDAVELPLLGVGGILNAAHAREYLNVGASLIQMGTATFADPRQPQRVARRLVREGWPRTRSTPRATSTPEVPSPLSEVTP